MNKKFLFHHFQRFIFKIATRKFQNVNILCRVISQYGEWNGIDILYLLGIRITEWTSQLTFSVRVSPCYSPPNQLYHYGLSFNC